MTSQPVPPQGVVAGVADDPVVGLRAAVDQVLHAEWWRCSEEAVRGAVVELERQAARFEAARLRLLATADERTVALAGGAASTGDWFAAATGTRPERARSRVQLAAALSAELAPTGQALAAGDLTVDHAAVVHTTMNRLDDLRGDDQRLGVDPSTRADAQAFLVTTATTLDPRRLAAAGRALVHRLDPGAGQDLARVEDTQTSRRQVRLSPCDDGTWLLSGLLDPVGGATLAAALDPLTAPRPSGSSGLDRRSAPRRRADALVQLADSYLAGQSGTEASRPRLVVTVPADAVLAPDVPGTPPATLEATGTPLSPLTLATLCCDAEVVPVLTDPATGSPLDVGRTVYSFPERQRRAIRARDGHCTFPGCTRPAAWTQIHHLQPWSQGGQTSERNGASVCGHHHRVVHRHGWRGELVGAQVVWHPPDGTAPRHPPPAWVPALDRLVERWRQRAA